MGGQRGLQTITRRHGDEAAGLGCEQCADSTGIAPASSDPGENQRAGVDHIRGDAGGGVLRADETAQRRGVDAAIFGIRRQQNIGLVQQFAPDHPGAIAAPLQHDPRKHQMSRGRSDIHARTHQPDFGVTLRRATAVGEEHPPALRHIALRWHSAPGNRPAACG